MKKEFLIERQGRTFCLYAGLIDAAHANGLQSIFTSLVQIPEEANGHTAICKATVTLDRDGKILTFEGIGDAAPNNVAPAMRNCLIRMAETRAKARALRDAVNVGVTAFEELGDDGATEDAPERGTPIRSVPQTAPATEEVSNVPMQYERCPECNAPHGKIHGTACKVGIREAQRTMAAMAR